MLDNCKKYAFHLQLKDGNIVTTKKHFAAEMRNAKWIISPFWLSAAWRMSCRCL